MISTSFAESRFGLGARGDEPAAGSDPRGWAAAQLTRFDSHVTGIPDSRSVAVELADYLDFKQAARRLARDHQAMMPAASSMLTPAAMPKPAKTPEIMAAQQAG